MSWSEKTRLTFDVPPFDGRWKLVAEPKVLEMVIGPASSSDGGSDDDDEDDHHHHGEEVQEEEMVLGGLLICWCRTKLFSPAYVRLIFQ